MKKDPKRVAAPLQQSSGGIARGDDVHVPSLVRDLGALIDEARRQVATVADATLVRLHWRIGHRIQMEVLEGRRAEYGGKIVAAVSRQLEALGVDAAVEATPTVTSKPPRSQPKKSATKQRKRAGR